MCHRHGKKLSQLSLNRIRPIADEVAEPDEARLTRDNHISQ